MESRSFGGSVSVSGVLGVFVLGTPLGWFVHADRFGVLALVQLTLKLYIGRTARLLR